MHLQPDPRLRDAPPGWLRQTAPGYVIHSEPMTDVRLAFAESVARGLSDHPRWLSCTYLYDRQGSSIFEQITRQPEYYQTRTENAILARCAGALRRRTGGVSLVELGSGSSAKTRHLLSAWCREGPARYVPIDVSRSALEHACRELTRAFPGLTVEGFASTYEQALPLAARFSPFMLLFLGSTIGNFNRRELDGFLDMVAGQLAPGDFLLLGADQVKSPDRLEKAYNDQAGWTARFVLNLFTRMNRELGCRIPLEAVEHVAYYNDRLEQIEIYARFRRQVRLDLPSIGRHFRLAAGEMVLIEISRKFRPSDLEATLNRFGFSLESAHADPERLFSVLLFRRRRDTPFADNRKHRLAALLHQVGHHTLRLLDPLPAGPGKDDPVPALEKAALPHLDAVSRREMSWLVQSTQPTHGSPSKGESDAKPASPAPAARSLRAARARLARARQGALASLAKTTLDPTRALTTGGLVYWLVAEREARCQERILEEFQRLQDQVYKPADRAAPPPRPDRNPSADSFLIPEGEFLMGLERGRPGRDCEQPRHRVRLQAFRIDATPVTNGQYLDFMRSGGYQDRESWLAEGWAWKCRTDRRHPTHWRRKNGIWEICRFGRWEALDCDRPVAQVTWFEARAYARWAGKRLPTEEEWEKAAAWNPQRGQARPYPWGETGSTGNHANLDQTQWEPVAVGSYPMGRSFYGCHQMIGDVWEWTESAFLPYPGFQPLPGPWSAQRLFGTHARVLRGGAWSSLSFAIRNTTRRSAAPDAQDLFAGFRCASDA
ncbi:MAG: L-histidine N(alpha)-methyltransferase [Acidobacteriota bacterium]